jgi:hypothetical protein
LIPKSIIIESKKLEPYDATYESWADSDRKPTEPYWIRCKLSTGLDSEIAKRHLPVEKKSDEYIESRADFYERLKSHRFDMARQVSNMN